MYNFYENIENKMRIILNGDLNYLSSFNNIEYNAMCNIFRYEFTKTAKYVDIELGNRVWRIVIEKYDPNEISKNRCHRGKTMLFNGKEMKCTILYDIIYDDNFEYLYSELLRLLDKGINFLLQDATGAIKDIKVYAPFIIFLHLTIYYEKSDVDLRKYIRSYYFRDKICDENVDRFEYIIQNYSVYDTLDCGGIIYERYEVYSI